MPPASSPTCRPDSREDSNRTGPRPL
jgi:hypothetical protein